MQQVFKPAGAADSASVNDSATSATALQGSGSLLLIDATECTTRIYGTVGDDSISAPSSSAHDLYVPPGVVLTVAIDGGATHVRWVAASGTQDLAWQRGGLAR